MDGIRRLTTGRTTFIIAHRLSTIRNCDLILVLRDGVIAERGTFAELMRCNGVFAELYNTQFRDHGKETARRRLGRRAEWGGWAGSSARPQQ